MRSIWQDTAKMPEYDELQGDIKTEVLVVGGGLCGLLCAHKMQKAGTKCAVIEANRICGGVTGNTTAKLTFAHGLIYDKLIKTYGTETAKGYLDANREALLRYRVMCEGMDCDLEECDSFVYSLTSREKITDEVKALKSLGADAEFVASPPLPFSVKGAVRVSGQAQFHPLKFAFALAKDLNIYENTRALEIEAGKVTAERGTVRADKIIVATHFPFIDRYGGYFLKMYQHRSYVLVLKDAPPFSGMLVDESDTGLSFRRYGEYTLLGGGGHRTGGKGGCWDELSDFAKRYYKGAKEVCRYATQDCMTLDGIPYIGQYGKNTDGIYVATGFNKWGMTSSMIAATLLTDMITGVQSPYAKVFDPHRSIFHPQLLSNAFHSILGLLTPTVPRCPHLGCALKYNKYEHTWDCPCHGSRFDEKGTVIDTPANKNKKVR